MVNIYESIKQLHDESIQQQIAIISLQTTITTEQASQQTSLAKLQASLNHAYHLLLDLSTKVSSLTTSSPNSFINNHSPIGINYSQVANTHNLNPISNSSFSPSPLSKNRNPSNINYDIDIDIFDSSLNASNPQILKSFSDPHIEFVVGIPDSSFPFKTALSNNIDTSVSIITTPDNTPLPIAPFIQPPQLLLTSSLSTLLPSYSTTNRVPYQSASALLITTKADSSGSTTSTNSTSQALKLESHKLFLEMTERGRKSNGYHLCLNGLKYGQSLVYGNALKVGNNICIFGKNLEHIYARLSYIVTECENVDIVRNLSFVPMLILKPKVKWKDKFNPKALLLEHRINVGGKEVLIFDPGGLCMTFDTFRRCRAYVNSYVTFTDGGRKWRCILCTLLNDVPGEYFSSLDANGRRYDIEQMPELIKGSVEFFVPTENMVRPDMQSLYLFVINESATAVQSGELKVITNVEFAFSPAFKAAFMIVSQLGGKLLIFQSTLPSLSIGRLRLRGDDSRVYEADREHKARIPEDPFYNQVAAEFTKTQIPMDIYAFSNKYSDIASLGSLTNYTGCQIYYYPSFNLSIHEEKLKHELARDITRETAWEGVMHIRCGKGVQFTTYHGHLVLGSTNLLALPAVDYDKAFAMQLTLDETLMTTQIVYFQVALLYTSSSSERQIRVHIAAAHVVTDLGEMYHEADTSAIISLLSKLAIENTLSHKLEDAHMLIQLKVVKSLTEYRNLHAMQHRLSSLILFPESLKYLALYAFSLSRIVALRDGFNDTYIGYFSTKIEYVDIMKNLNEFVYDSISRVKWKDTDYTLYAKDLIKCKLVVHAKKVLIFDPGSYISDRKETLLDILTLRTRSFSERVVMICITICSHQE